MAQWDEAGLPEFQVNLREQIQDPVLRTATDTGPPLVRRRYTAVSHFFTGTLMLRVDTARNINERAVLDTFYTITAKSGTVSFTKKDPTTGTVGNFLFIRPPEYRVVASDANGRGSVYRVQVALERLP